MGFMEWIAKKVETKKRLKEGDSYVNIVQEAREYNASLNAMGLHNNSEEGVKMRKIGMWEITSKKFEFLKNYKEDAFLKQADDTTKKVIEHKAKGKSQ